MSALPGRGRAGKDGFGGVSLSLSLKIASASCGGCREERTYPKTETLGGKVKHGL